MASAWSWASHGPRSRREGGVSRAALGGAALVHLAALAGLFLEIPLERRAPGAPGAPRITLVVDASNSEAASETESQAPAAPPSPPAETAADRPSPPADAQPSPAHLDDLFGAAAKTPSAAATRSTLDSLFGAEAPSRSASKADARATAKSAGAARPMTGLQPGESLGGVDLYAAASLPPVGPRPSHPSGDLWRRIQPCWRPIVHAPAELVVKIGPHGELLGEPAAIRRQDAVAVATLVAERSVLRAVQACAPFTGVGPGRWRVAFPAG